MGTVLFLFETLTAGTFSSRGARTLSDEHVRPCVIVQHLIAGGRGRIGRDVSVPANTPGRRRAAGHVLRGILMVPRWMRTHHSSDLSWTVLTNGLNVLFPLPQVSGDRSHNSDLLGFLEQEPRDLPPACLR